MYALVGKNFWSVYVKAKIMYVCGFVCVCVCVCFPLEYFQEVMYSIIQVNNLLHISFE